MNKVIISAPFGNYLNVPGCTRTLGTYTVPRRAGFWLRLWRVIKTVRYYWRTQAWINKLGLPNPGIESLKSQQPDCLLSIHGFNAEEWKILVAAGHRLGVEGLEFNLSCPNIDHRSQMLNEVEPAMLSALQHTNMKVVAKLPPVRWMDMGLRLYDLGVRYFHLCNTIPTPGGGMSGKPLMQYSLWAIDDFRQRFGDAVTLIGGGGITCLEDVRTFVKAGADHVAIGSTLFNLFNNRSKLREFAAYFNELPDLHSGPGGA